jgi:hypothetical protein
MYLSVEGRRVLLALDSIGRHGRRTEILDPEEARCLAAVLYSAAEKYAGDCRHTQSTVIDG